MECIELNWLYKYIKRSGADKIPVSTNSDTGLICFFLWVLLKTTLSDPRLNGYMWCGNIQF